VCVLLALPPLALACQLQTDISHYSDEWFSLANAFQLSALQSAFTVYNSSTELRNALTVIGLEAVCVMTAESNSQHADRALALFID
jgi:hypothetical protein